MYETDAKLKKENKKQAWSLVKESIWLDALNPVYFMT
jgi:hypothetical protein